MVQSKRVGILLLVLGVMFMLGVSRASADTFYTLDTGNSGGLGCCAGPYATVSVELTGATTAVVSFSTLDNGGYQYLMAATSAAAVNVNAGSWAISNINGGNAFPGFTTGPLTDGGSNVNDGFGTFNQNINSFDGFTHSATFIQFALQDLSGTWGTSDDVLTANATGFLASIHGFACADPCTIDSGAFATGYASTGGGGGGGGGGEGVPEPSSSLLLGIGLSGVGFVTRKWRSLLNA